MDSREELKICPNVYIHEEDYRKHNPTWAYVSGKSNQRSGYTNTGRVLSYDLYLIHGRKVGSFKTDEEREAFLQERLNPPVVAEKVYPDICRCGALATQIRYGITKGMVWERHEVCGRPLRYADMIELNKGLLDDVDFDDFLNS
jgi:hypothetical protein